MKMCVRSVGLDLRALYGPEAAGGFVEYVQSSAEREPCRGRNGVSVS